jgi:uncharacterized glyoxalase superfamily protein PhnB
MTKNAVKPIPEGFHTLTPHIVVKGLKQAVDFYKKAYGAQAQDLCEGPDGRLMHAELKIGDSILLLCEESAEYGALSPLSTKTAGVTLHLYVADADLVFNRAVKAGARVRMPVADMFWGDRYGQLLDPFGHTWAIATHQEDLTKAEIAKRQEDFFAVAR